VEKIETIITADDMSGNVLDIQNCTGARVLTRTFPPRQSEKVGWATYFGGHFNSNARIGISGVTSKNQDGDYISMMKAKVGDIVIITKQD